jgi:hypothetical protein
LPGDPRSDLLLSITRDGTALSFLFYGLPPLNQSDHISTSRDLNPELIAAINLLTQLRRRNYRTPTFISHSRIDEVASFTAADTFIRELSAKGVSCRLGALDRVSHLHDLRLQPGGKGWEEGVEAGYKFLIDLVKVSR